MSEILNCVQCDIEISAPVVERIDLPGGKFHLKASCPKCGRYLKFLAQDGPKVLHFGKYRDRPLADIAATDPEYLRWLVQQEWLRPKLKRDIEQELSR